MGWKSKIEQVDSDRDCRRELKRLEDEAARLRLRIAAARFDHKFTLGDHPYLAAALALSAGFAVGYSPGLRRALLKTSSLIVNRLLQA
jgi:hypothetical protein